MKNNNNGKRALESYKIFPFVAWGLTIGFTVFVYNIAMELQDVADNLERQANYIENQINKPLNEIEIE